MNSSPHGPLSIFHVLPNEPDQFELQRWANEGGYDPDEYSSQRPGTTLAYIGRPTSQSQPIAKRKASGLNRKAAVV